MSQCQTCGACCAAYRVQFSVYELDDMGGAVPVTLTETVNGSTCRMRGTGEVPIRCVALSGSVGTAVGCTIYALRPRPCTELQEGSYACNKARQRHGLPPLDERPEH
ncbi:YkgJ family cysteine cluster protein [Hydrogenophaga taeniospiralis]|uniref:YkgJ family cysteine cluster protein n=1 Tax=Hydrogenophaga taeniospiralis TaxID=65656 RepID=UPI001CFA379E|nr:YkgJ family cysteine cluster protein [Hydrogenophaga taeniospiralis]MCB4366425.1 YkgJ family cysteine cluster protein [Hydrogenophaga taeniospiralis]